MREDLSNPSEKYLYSKISKKLLHIKLFMTNAIEPGAICVTQRYF